MAAQEARPRYALDTNVLIDLGEGLPFAKTFLTRYQSQGLRVPPTVVQELTHIATSPDHDAQPHALRALMCMREWKIAPFDLISVGHGITEANTRKLFEAGLLDEEEFNDGLIVIETALACIPTLVTSDNHLLKISPAKLTEFLNSQHLSPISIYHPRDLLGR